MQTESWTYHLTFDMLVRLGHQLIDHIAAFLGCLLERQPRREMPHYSRFMSVAWTTGYDGVSGVLTPWKKVGQECAWNCGTADHVHGVFCVCDILRRLSARYSVRGTEISTWLSAVLTDRPYVTDRMMRPAVLNMVKTL